MNCLKCGKENAEGLTLCKFCGAELSIVSKSSVPAKKCGFSIASLVFGLIPVGFFILSAIFSLLLTLNPAERGHEEEHWAAGPGMLFAFLFQYLSIPMTIFGILFGINALNLTKNNVEQLASQNMARMGIIISTLVLVYAVITLIGSLIR